MGIRFGQGFFLARPGPAEVVPLSVPALRGDAGRLAAAGVVRVSPGNEPTVRPEVVRSVHEALCRHDADGLEQLRHLSTGEEWRAGLELRVRSVEAPCGQQRQTELLAFLAGRQHCTSETAEVILARIAAVERAARDRTTGPATGD
jgi:hypothetical protein